MANLQVLLASIYDRLVVGNRERNQTMYPSTIKTQSFGLSIITFKPTLSALFTWWFAILTYSIYLVRGVDTLLAIPIGTPHPLRFHWRGEQI